MNGYILEIKKINHFLFIKLNGMPVFIHSGMRVLEANLPINQFVINGLNRIEILVMPNKGELVLATDTFCEISIKNTVNNLSVIDFKTPSFSKINEQEFSIEKDFSILIEKNPFYNNSFEILGNREGEIINFYKKIWEILKVKKLDEYFEETKIKDHELAEAFNISYKERIEDLRQFMKNILDDNSMKLQPINNRKLNINYYCEKRVVALEDEDFNPAIFFEDDASDFVSRFRLPIYLCLNEKNEFIIIR
jgi:hypothetical protein